jgi:hypothetical protein
MSNPQKVEKLSYAQLIARQAELKAQLEKLENESKEAKNEQVKKYGEICNSLPEMFEMENLIDEKKPDTKKAVFLQIAHLVKCHANGTLSSVVDTGSHSYKRLNDDEKNQVDNLLKSGKSAKEIASQFGVSIPTVYLRKKNLSVKPAKK